MNDIYMKRVKDLKSRPGVTQRWVARDRDRGLVGVGQSRIEATRKMQPEEEIAAGSFDHAFLAAAPLRWEHKSETV